MFDGERENSPEKYKKKRKSTKLSEWRTAIWKKSRSPPTSSTRVQNSFRTDKFASRPHRDSANFALLPHSGRYKFYNKIINLQWTVINSKWKRRIENIISNFNPNGKPFGFTSKEGGVCVCVWRMKKWMGREPRENSSSRPSAGVSVTIAFAYAC